MSHLIFSLICYFCINSVSIAEQESTTVDTIANITSQDDILGPDFAICDSLPKRRQRSCKMVLQIGAEARKSELDGDLTEEELPPPSVGIGLPLLRNITTADDQKAQPPPKVVAERYACLDMFCLCPYLGGEPTAPDQCLFEDERNNETRTRRQSGRANRRLGKALRMEYRMLSDQQRHQFHEALKQLKHGHNSYEYNRLTFLHSNPRLMPSAHSGPTFLLWHREYLKRSVLFLLSLSMLLFKLNACQLNIIFIFILEIALRSIDPSVAVPYWDSTIDQRLDNPKDSIIWSNLFAGSTDANGNVVDGFLGNWITSNGRPVRRNLGADGELLMEEEINSIINRRQIEYIFGFPSRRQNRECTLPTMRPQDVLEFNHNNVHTWIGGDMRLLSTSAQDPIFFLHHCFVDYVWEQWRQKWQSRNERETQFPRSSQIVPCSGSRNYLLSATMLPFNDPPLLNRVGLSNDYTDNLYSYAPRPTCKLAGDCGSSYLFCDTTNGVPLCCAKIKPLGNCAKFSGNSEEPCYASSCVNGQCQPKNNGQIVARFVDQSSSCNESDSSSNNGTTSTLDGYDDGHNNSTAAVLQTTAASAADEYDQQNTATTSAAFSSFAAAGADTAPTSSDYTSTFIGQPSPYTDDDISTTPSSTTTESDQQPYTPPLSSIPPTSTNDRECFDNHECCDEWAADNGACRTAPRYMNTWCPGSCHFDGCRPHPAQRIIRHKKYKDMHSQCKRWAHFHERFGHGEGWRSFKPGKVLKKNATRNECQRNAHWMARNCAEACGTTLKHISSSSNNCSKSMPKDYYVLEPIGD